MQLRDRIFGQTGLRVSSIALGTGNFGKGWGYGAEREEVQRYSRERMLPIIGPRTLEQLADNLASAEAKLSAEQIQRLDNVSAITLGFPHDVVSGTSGRLAGGKAELTDIPLRPVR